MQVREESLSVLDGVLLPNLDLLFNQHLSNVVACCIYGAARCALQTRLFQCLCELASGAPPFPLSHAGNIGLVSFMAVYHQFEPKRIGSLD